MQWCGVQWCTCIEPDIIFAPGLVTISYALMSQLIQSRVPSPLKYGFQHGYNDIIPHRSQART